MEPIQFKKCMPIKTAEDYEDVCYEVLDNYLEDFRERKGLTREPNQDDLYDFDGCVDFMYTQKGMRLYDSAIRHLTRLGNKIFPGERFNLRCSLMIFP